MSYIDSNLHENKVILSKESFIERNALYFGENIFRGFATLELNTSKNSYYEIINELTKLDVKLNENFIIRPFLKGLRIREDIYKYPEAFAAILDEGAIIGINSMQLDIINSKSKIKELLDIKSLFKEKSNSIYIKLSKKEGYEITDNFLKSIKSTSILNDTDLTTLGIDLSLKITQLPDIALSISRGGNIVGIGFEIGRDKSFYSCKLNLNVEDRVKEISNVLKRSKSILLIDSKLGSGATVRSYIKEIFKYNSKIKIYVATAFADSKGIIQNIYPTKRISFLQSKGFKNNLNLGERIKIIELYTL